MTEISDWVLAGNPLWFWLVALMWLANVVFLVFACRSYLAARAASRNVHDAHGELGPAAKPAGPMLRSTGPVEPAMGDPAPGEPLPVPLMVERFNSDSLLVPSHAVSADDPAARLATTDADSSSPADTPAFIEATASSPDVVAARRPALDPTAMRDAFAAEPTPFAQQPVGNSSDDRASAEQRTADTVTGPRSLDAPAAQFVHDAVPAHQAHDAASGHLAHESIAAAHQEGPDILLAALRRIQEHPDSARPFRELIRALYLDQSVFTFDCLADLDTGDRQLALALLKAWLSGTYDADRWEDAFRDSQLDSLSKEMFAALPGDKAM